MSKKKETVMPEETINFNPWIFVGSVLVVGFGIAYVASQSAWLLLLSAVVIGIGIGFVFGWNAKEHLG